MFTDEEMYADDSTRNNFRQMSSPKDKEVLNPMMSEWDKWNCKRIKSFSSFYIKVIRNNRVRLSSIE